MLNRLIAAFVPRGIKDFRAFAALAVFAALAGFTSLVGCRTVHYSEMSPTGTIAQLLPPLEVEIDIRSLESVFGETITSGFISDIGFYGGVSYANPLVRDIITLYERDMRNVAEEYGPRRGVVVCRLIRGEVGGGGFGWAFVSGLTLLVPNIFGMPFAYAKSAMELEMSIFDVHGELVGRYASNYHKGRVPVALYYGYGSDAALKVAIGTFKACMTDIKGQIELDFGRLNGALESAAGGSLRNLDGAVPGAPREPSLREEW